MEISSGGDAAKKANINNLKEFYLQRLAKAEPQVAARLNATAPATPQFTSGGGGIGALQPQASGQAVSRPNFATASAGQTKDIEDLEIMCNNCFNLIKSSEASSCTGDPAGCPIAQRSGSTGGARPSGQIAVLDMKLQKLRAALEGRLQDASSKVNVMRHLTQLRYHIGTAEKWTPGCSEIGALSDHTVQQVKQLTATSRVLAPAVYIFSKRIENVVVQKEKELRRVNVHSTSASVNRNSDNIVLDMGRDVGGNESVADANSVISEFDSDCGTQYAETVVTDHGPSHDVGNVNDANDYLNLKNEDEQRRWFYSQCLTVKLACTDKARARKTLISDLYSKVRAEGVPIENWVQWIKNQLMPEEAGAAPAPASAPGARGSLDATVPVPTLGAQGARGGFANTLGSGGYPRR